MAEGIKEKDERLVDQLNVRIDRQLHRDFKEALLKKDTNAAEVIREYIKKFVSDAKKPVVY